MRVKDAMNPKVVIASKDISVKEAARIMTKFKIGSLVILENEKIEGIVTDSDIIRKVVATGLDPVNVTVEEIMSKTVIAVDISEDLGVACQMMVENKIKRLPVLEDGKLVGIITTSDIISVEPKMIKKLAEILLVSEKQVVAG